MTSDQNSFHRLVLDSMTFGNSCRRCNVYYVTTNKTEELCPWCRRTQAGLDQERTKERADDQNFEGI